MHALAFSSNLIQSFHTMTNFISLPATADDAGFFGEYGGIYTTETLIPVLEELRLGFRAAECDPAFLGELKHALRDWAGRPTPLYHAVNLSRTHGADIYFKREDLLHGGAHKTNNALGQVMLAKRMGKTRIIAETGAGQHGVATALAAAKLGLPCVVYMGAVDAARQAPNVQRMKLLGAEVIEVQSGSRTLKDAINAALRDWIASCETTYYVLGTVAGPHPFPAIGRFFQTIIGAEARAQCLEDIGRLPDYAVACVGGGSNAIGLFAAFLEDGLVDLIGVEPAGEGLDTPRHGAVLAKGEAVVLHGMRSLGLQDADGQILETHSVSAGLDYPLIGPEHAHLRDTGCVTYASITDDEAIAAVHETARAEGIIPAIESAHAIAHALKIARENSGKKILVNLSGRGDKDLHILESYKGSSHD